jgi:hypothetical protein
MTQKLETALDWRQQNRLQFDLASAKNAAEEAYANKRRSLSRQYAEGGNAPTLDMRGVEKLRELVQNITPEEFWEITNRAKAQPQPINNGTNQAAADLSQAIKAAEKAGVWKSRKQ